MMKMPLIPASKVGFAAALTFALAAAPVSAETITVCAKGCDYTSINAAIAVASDGDVIQLSAETYFEGQQIDTLGKAITLQGATDKAGNTASILDGGGSHRVIQCQGGESGRTAFSHLLIRNGRATNGAGMYNKASSPTLTDCVFVDNQCSGRGGGIYNRDGSSPTLVRVRFSRNRASSGGGIYNFDESSPTLIDCRLEGNSAPTVGGGMTNWKACSPILIRCVFVDNTSNDSSGGGGGGMYNYGSGSPRLDSCSFVGNTSTNGAGIYVVGGALILNDCQFQMNVADIAGGICNEYAAITATRCFFRKNSAAKSGAAMTIKKGTSLLVDCGFDENAPTAITMDAESELQLTNGPVVPGDLDLDGDFDVDDARLAMSMFELDAETAERLPAERLSPGPGP